MGTTGSSETSVTNYQSTPRNIPGGRSPRVGSFSLQSELLYNKLGTCVISEMNSVVWKLMETIRFD